MLLGRPSFYKGRPSVHWAGTVRVLTTEWLVFIASSAWQSRSRLIGPTWPETVCQTAAQIPSLFGAPNKLESGHDPELDVGIGEVGFDYAVTDEQPARDRQGCLPSDCHTNDLTFAPGEGVRPDAEGCAARPALGAGQEDL